MKFKMADGAQRNNSAANCSIGLKFGMGHYGHIEVTALLNLYAGT